MVKKADAAPSRRFADRPARLTGPDNWSIRTVHGAASPYSEGAMAEALADGWEPFAVDQGVMYLRRRYVA